MIPVPRLTGAKSTLERTKHAAVICHRKPDGDALGSAIGLGLLLRARGIMVSLVCFDPIPAQYHFLPEIEVFRQDVPENADTIVMVDCATDRLSGFDIAELSQRTPLIDIDHHPKATLPAGRRLALYDNKAAAAAEMIFELADYAEWELSRDGATALLTGIVTDTSAFQNSNTTTRTLEVAAALLRKGARLREIVRYCFYSSSIPKLRLWGTAMARIEQNAQAAGIVSTVLTKEDVTSCGAHPDDIDGLVNFLNAIPGVPALLLLTDMQTGEVKGSLRSRNQDINVDRLARLLGGGGHRQAAGFTIPGRLVKNVDQTWEVIPAPEAVAAN